MCYTPRSNLQILLNQTLLFFLKRERSQDYTWQFSSYSACLLDQCLSLRPSWLLITASCCCRPCGRGRGRGSHHLGSCRLAEGREWWSAPLTLAGWDLAFADMGSKPVEPILCPSPPVSETLKIQWKGMQHLFTYGILWLFCLILSYDHFCFFFLFKINLVILWYSCKGSGTSHPPSQISSSHWFSLFYYNSMAFIKQL